MHPPFDEDDCTACHADHGDEGRLVLVAAGNALCEGCHESADPGFLKAHHDVRGSKVACTSCHDPHRSTEEHLLLPNRHRPLAFGRCDPCHRYDGKLHKPVRELCLGCHGGEEFTRRIAHAPVKRGECLACHDPHASRQPALLKARYAPGRWIGREGDVALCLGCHDRRNFFSGEAETTLFRSGGSNLHALHVNASGPARGGQPRQSISCRNCHEVHSSEEPRLVRRELDCGGVPCLKLEFRRTDSGGQCLSGCHAPQSYAFAGAPAPAAPAAPPPPVAAAQRAATALPEQSALERSINKSCVACHEKAVKRFAKARIHAPVRAGACSFCHLDHGPENRLILLGREDRICARCHDPGSEASRAAHGGFALEGSRCTECHDPHGGEAAGFVYERRHPPFAEGDCGSCHGKPAGGVEDRREHLRGLPGVPRRDRTREIPARRARRQRLPRLSPGARRAGEGAAARRAPRALLHLPPAPALRAADGSRPGARGRLRRLPPGARGGERAPAGPPLPDRAVRPLRPRALRAVPGVPRRGRAHRPGARGRHRVCGRDEEPARAAPARPGVAARNSGPASSPASPAATATTRTRPNRPRLIRRVLDCNGVPCLQIEFKKIGAGGKCLGGCHINQSYLPAGR